ncbi:DUF1989 domain-containing protein [Janibacter cremeus]|uniref:DUF1989 domain-containing protein n=1 Tax=Janibacter cremeus TaxID=1285192 RepID=UPI0023F76B53|nr:DUF1989 domain-containing protein [Janibacter cremeus]WEV78717.1 DUF1989 domain-containing protein [Janibacter cremeus]
MRGIWPYGQDLPIARDDGTTGRLFGGRVGKDDPLVEGCGDIDEAVVDLVRASAGEAEAPSHEQVASRVVAELLPPQPPVVEVGACAPQPSSGSALVGHDGSMSLTDAAYQSDPGGPLDLDRDLYGRIGSMTEGRELVDSFVVPIRSGRAWEVPAGHVCRIVTIEGPQVADLNLWNRHDPRERLWAARTRQLQSAHVSTFDRLWSTLPFLRPLVTITGDSLEDYGVDEEGGRVHDLLGTRCDPYVNQMLNDAPFDYHCHSNLTRAVRPWHLTEFDVHDVLNVFQCTGLNERDEYFMKTCPATKGDYFEFFAEIDLLAALSACPGGDLSVPMFGPEAGDTEAVCRPLGIEVYSVPDEALAGWQPPQRAAYAQDHGLRARPWA